MVTQFKYTQYKNTVIDLKVLSVDWGLLTVYEK